MAARVVLPLLLFLSGLPLALRADSAAARRAADEKSLFVTVLDPAGKPLTDLTGADFAVREDGVDREVVRAVRATDPLRVALLADTTPGAEEFVPTIRAGFKAFVQDVLAASPDAEISLWEFGQAAVRITNFTKDKAALDKDVGRLFPKPRAASVLLEAIYDTSEALAARPSPRRAIVTLNVEPSDEQSRQEPKKTNESLRRSRAQLWALSVQKGTLKNAQRDLVLNTFVRNAGGMREYIVTDTAIEGYMRRYAAALTSQYELTYLRPSGRPQVVQTGVRRDGAKVIAGIFAPQ